MHPAWHDRAPLRRGRETDRLESGLTAPAIQQQFGFHEPVFGCILDSRATGHVFTRDELIEPGFEIELCLHVRQELSGEITWRQRAPRSMSVHPSLEIIETRGDFVRQIAVALADNAQQKTVILGKPVPLGDALETVACTVRIDDEVVAQEPEMPCSAIR